MNAENPENMNIEKLRLTKTNTNKFRQVCLKRIQKSSFSGQVTLKISVS